MMRVENVVRMSASVLLLPMKASAMRRRRGVDKHREE